MKVKYLFMTVEAKHLQALEPMFTCLDGRALVKKILQNNRKNLSFTHKLREISLNQG